MGDAFVGADPERMAQLQAVLVNGAGELSAVRFGAAHAIEALNSIWRGDVTDAFAHVWRARHMVTIANAQASLEQAAEIVGRNLEAQLRTSDTLEGGFSGLGGDGALAATLSGTTMADRIRAASDPSSLVTEDEKNGDRGGTLEAVRRDDFRSNEGDGIDAVVEALNHTADPTRIAKDEFEIVHLDNGKTIVVLPGVTDLTDTLISGGITASGPLGALLKGQEFRDHLGWDPNSYTARDTWIAARESLETALIEDNLYAQLVEDYFEEQIALGNIEPGGDVMIVGHSFGADTAIDLASDPNFNGEVVNVTHVVAAAYHSGPQLSSIPGDTRVAVLQNMADPAIAGEALASGDFGTALRPVDNLARKATEGGSNLGISGVNGVAEGAAEGTEFIVENSANAISSVGNFFNPFGDPLPSVEIELDVPNIGHVDFTETSVTQYSDNVVVSQFYGGFEGAGHGQGNYTDYLTGDGSSDLDDFFSDVADAGYTGDGAALAVDVSVPEHMR